MDLRHSTTVDSSRDLVNERYVTSLLGSTLAASDPLVPETENPSEAFVLRSLTSPDTATCGREPTVLLGAAEAASHPHTELDPTTAAETTVSADVGNDDNDDDGESDDGFRPEVSLRWGPQAFSYNTPLLVAAPLLFRR